MSQKRSRKPAFVAVKATNAMRNKAAVHRFRAASFAGALCCTAHSEKPLDRPENECIHFLAGHRFFLCPEALFTPLKFQAQIVCLRCQAGSSAEVQEMKSPGAGQEGSKRPERLPVAGFQRRAGRKAPDAEASNVSPPNYCVSNFTR